MFQFSTTCREQGLAGLFVCTGWRLCMEKECLLTAIISLSKTLLQLWYLENSLTIVLQDYIHSFKKVGVCRFLCPKLLGLPVILLNCVHFELCQL